MLTAIFFVTCLAAKNFSPVPRQNPWPDDYSHICGMENWRKWGTYNVHDPSCRKIGDTYYMYSTDAIFRENRKKAVEKNVPIGFIQMRSSKDLVNWKFSGWVFPEIPREAVEWVRSNSGGHGATNIWAPYIVDCKNGTFRLYYCVSAFGRNTSYIGMAVADNPEGPWIDKGAVVRTNRHSNMNAIDPTVVTDTSGRQWMHYGSYFGGLYCVELDPATGFTKQAGDHGHLVARRANWRRDNLEAPEIIHNIKNGKYYLFYSYDPLESTYNVRAGRADNAEGPFLDFNGQNIADTTNNFPILTAPYRFKEHPGWVGTAHCSVFTDGDGNFFMAHQGRFAPQNAMMDLHVRQLFFTSDGWPVVSPERYAGTPARKFDISDISGDWEIIRVLEPDMERADRKGQPVWGERSPGEKSINNSISATFVKGGGIIMPRKDGQQGKWNFDENSQTLTLNADGEEISGLIVHSGHDWEREADTVLFTGLDSTGRTVWGKRIK